MTKKIKVYNLSKLELTNFESLLDLQKDFKVRSATQIEKLANRIIEVGFKYPAVVWKQKDKLWTIDAHGRRAALQFLKGKGFEIPKIPYFEVSAKNIEEAKKEILYLNSNYGEIDFDSNFFLENFEKDLDFNLELKQDFELHEEEIESSEAEDTDLEPPKQAITVFGDLYELNYHRLHCNDSTDSNAVGKLMDGEKADMVFTSPPYNANTSLTISDKNNKNLYRNNEIDNKTREDYIKFNIQVVKNILSNSTDTLTLLYNINYNKNSPSAYIDVVSKINKLILLKETIVWEKQLAVSLQGNNLTRIYEFIFVFNNINLKINKGHSECFKNLWKISNINANIENHKACFPLELPTKAILDFSPKGSNIYEPFIGSGTTLIACEQTDRICYGQELDEKYCDVTVKRWINFMKDNEKKFTVKRNGKVLSEEQIKEFIK